MNRTYNDTWLGVVGISLLMALVLTNDDTYRQPINGLVLVRLLFALSTIIITWHLNRAIILKTRSTVTGPRTWLYRFMLTFGSCVLATTWLAWVMAGLQYGVVHRTLTGYTSGVATMSITFNHNTLTLNKYGFDWLQGVLNALFSMILYGGLFAIQDVQLYRKRLQQSERERELLQMANMQSQLDVLKQQVNPHFLFNSLNALSALISENPVQAELFVDKLSEVYRYVLQATSEQHLTTLEAELQFIDAYYHLLQTRYGTGVQLRVTVDDDQRTGKLPPLTLQLLVENAVKHNIVLPACPLMIGIFLDEQSRLVVQNTLQRKATRAISNGVGLTNIVAKYRLLNLPQPTIEETSEAFVVRLSLVTGTGGTA
ncbi:MAG: sensor protein lytS [Cytophagaceae bacterium]|nr:MAG: sensor protein lytS [Cytophagaceae bacterium]